MSAFGGASLYRNKYGGVIPEHERGTIQKDLGGKMLFILFSLEIQTLNKRLNFHITRVA